MAAELREADIRRVVQDRMKAGSLSVTTSTIPIGNRASGGTRCIICGSSITAGRNECEVSGLRAHERCAVIWREESDRIL